MTRKVIIFTYWWSEDNYGQLLQAFALQQHLKSADLEVEISCFRKTESTVIDTIVNIIKKILFPILGREFPNDESLILHNQMDRKFSNFRSREMQFTNSRYSSFKELKKHPPHADYYLCGSDKIWATYPRDPIRSDVFDAYSLAFGNEAVKRIAYAPSIGKREIPYFAKKRFKRNLKSFQGISVREESAVTLLNDIGIDNVVWVPDPTQLIGKQGYMRFIEEVPGEYKKTWFFYGLRNPSYISSRVVAEHLVAGGVDFDYTGGNNNIDDLITCYPTIPQWLNHMYYADNIITNSYHGCIFCILFHKNFYYVPVLPDKKGLPDERIASLLNRYDIQGRDITTEEQLQAVLKNSHNPIDWDAVDEKMQEFAQVGKDFLAKHLGEGVQ